MNLLECMKQKRWLAIIPALAMFVIGLATYLAYTELYKIWKEHVILLKYGNIFLTPEQIRRLQAPPPARAQVDTQDKTTDGFCFSNQCGDASRYFSPLEGASKSSRAPSGKPSNSSDAAARWRENSLRPELSDQPRQNETETSPGSGSSGGGGSGGGGGPSVASGSTVASSEALTSQGRMYHGCCISQRNVYKPKREFNIYGKRVIVVQFKGRNQVVVNDECRQSRRCRGCQCVQTTAYVAAIVIDDDGRPLSDDDPQPNRGDFSGYRLDMIRVPGCCKCLNGV